MLELDFIIWLQNKEIPKKIISDYVSRLKRIEHSLLDCDIDEEFAKDKCEYLLSLFYKSGKNKEMARIHVGNLPIGKYYISTYKYVVRRYIEFKKFMSIQQEQK